MCFSNTLKEIKEAFPDIKPLYQGIEVSALSTSGGSINQTHEEYVRYIVCCNHFKIFHPRDEIIWMRSGCCYAKTAGGAAILKTTT